MESQEQQNIRYFYPKKYIANSYDALKKLNFKIVSCQQPISKQM